MYLGNGVSELIVMAMQALLDNGDEVLIPAPDYPLWTASVSLCGGRAVHYLLRREADWMPDLADIERKVTTAPRRSSSSTPTTRPVPSTRARCSSGITEIARRHNLLIFSDEIYDKILYDGAKHTPDRRRRPGPAHA